MASLSRKIAFAVRKLSLYEIADLILLSTLLAIFILCSKQLHQLFGIGQSRFILWDNIRAVYGFPLSYAFSVILAILACIYFGLKYTANNRLQRIKEIVRILASFCLMMVIYKVINFYICVFNPSVRDIVLQHIDRFLFFGKLPSEWIDPITTPVLTYIFFIAYMSWFTMIYVTLLLMWRHSTKAVNEYVTATIFAFYIGYITYAIVPAIGPIYTVHYSKSLGSIMNILTIGQSSLSRDCFPSLHTGISIVMLIFIRRYRKNLFHFYLFITIMIIASTQYLRVHYGIDVIAGAALGVGLCQVAPVWVEWWNRVQLRFRKTKPSILKAPHAADSVSELA